MVCMLLKLKKINNLQGDQRLQKNSLSLISMQCHCIFTLGPMLDLICDLPFVKDFRCPAWTPRSCFRFLQSACEMLFKAHILLLNITSGFSAPEVKFQPNFLDFQTWKPFSKLCFCFHPLKKLSLQTEIWHLYTSLILYIAYGTSRDPKCLVDGKHGMDENPWLSVFKCLISPHS